MSRHRHVAPNGDEVRPVMRMPGRKMEWHGPGGTIYARSEVRRVPVEDPKTRAPGKGRRKK